MNTHQHVNTGLFGALTGTSIWQLWLGLSKHAPSWELVPPLLVGFIGLVGVINTSLNDRHRRSLERKRLDAELYAAALDAAVRRRAMDKPSLN